MSRALHVLRAIAAFWWDFIVGDDWVVAVGVVLGLAATTALERHGISAWCVMPIAAPLLLCQSLARAAATTRRR